MERKERVDLSLKRPEKKLSLSFIWNQYQALKAGIGSKEDLKLQIAYGNYYLYETEVKELIESKKESKDFDGKDFVEHLKFFECVKKGAPPKIGEGIIGVDSLERAKQVANHPDNPQEVAQISEIMKQMTALRDKVDPLIDVKATCSIALKNKKEKKKKKSSEAETSVPA